jgi:hypothetical protein
VSKNLARKLRHFISYLLSVLSIWLFTDCAQQGILTGGEKDTSPPQIDSTKLEIPRNGSVNFSASRIVIPFNEFIALQDVRKQVIITPLLSTPPKIYVQGKKVVVDFENPLSPNTTYIINFGDAIRDITENNKLSNYKYVFSTGSFLDSLTYSAYVYDAYTKKPSAGALVMLYQNTNDSVVKKQKPMYFAKTDPNGKCLIENISENTYKVIALLDGNDNYLWDQKDEKIGFLVTERNIDAAALNNTDSIALFINVPDKKMIETVTFTNGLITASLNTPLIDLTWAEKIEAKGIWNNLVKLNATKDTIRWWINPEEYKKQDIEFSLEGYGKNKIRVTDLPDEKNLNFTTNVATNLVPGNMVELSFKQPLLSIDTSKIRLTTNERNNEFSVQQKNETTVVISALYKEDEDYAIEAFPGAFVSLYGRENDSLTLLFSCMNVNKLGTIHLHLTGPHFDEPNGNLIVLLRQADKTMHRTLLPKNSNKELFFEHLLPGKYEISVIFDANENGVWDTGDYFKRTFPEKVYYYPEPVDVRKGWDLELFWELGKVQQSED